MNRPRKLIGFRSLAEKKGLSWSRRHLDRLEAAGKFPKRVPLGERRFAYVEDEIDAYIADRIKARDAAASHN